MKRCNDTTFCSHQSSKRRVVNKCADENGSKRRPNGTGSGPRPSRQCVDRRHQHQNRSHHAHIARKVNPRQRHRRQQKQRGRGRGRGAWNGPTAIQSALCSHFNSGDGRQIPYRLEVFNLMEMADAPWAMNVQEMDKTKGRICREWNSLFQSGCVRRHCAKIHMTEHQFLRFVKWHHLQCRPDAAAEAEFERALQCLGRREYAVARSILMALSLRFEYNAVLNFWIGRSYHLSPSATVSLSAMQSANLYYRRALALSPGNGSFHAFYGEFSVHFGQLRYGEQRAHPLKCSEYKQAKHHLFKSLEIAECGAVHFVLAKFLDEVEHEYPRASFHYRLALSGGEGDDRMRLNYARLLHKMGKVDEAKRHFVALIDYFMARNLYLSSLWPHYHFGRLLVDGKEYDVAQKQFEICLEIMERNDHRYFAHIFYEFAKLLLFGLGDRQRAVEMIEIAVREAPEVRPYRKLLFRIKSEQWLSQQPPAQSGHSNEHRLDGIPAADDRVSAHSHSHSERDGADRSGSGSVRNDQDHHQNERLPIHQQNGEDQHDDAEPEPEPERTAATIPDPQTQPQPDGEGDAVAERECTDRGQHGTSTLSEMESDEQLFETPKSLKTGKSLSSSSDSTDFEELMHRIGGIKMGPLSSQKAVHCKAVVSGLYDEHKEQSVEPLNLSNLSNESNESLFIENQLALHFAEQPQKEMVSQSDHRHSAWGQILSDDDELSPYSFVPSDDEEIVARLCQSEFGRFTASIPCFAEADRFREYYDRLEDEQMNDVRCLLTAKMMDGVFLRETIGMDTDTASLWTDRVRQFVQQHQRFVSWLKTLGFHNKYYGKFENNAILTLRSLAYHVQNSKDLAAIIGRDEHDANKIWQSAKEIMKTM